MLIRIRTISGVLALRACATERVSTAKMEVVGTPHK